MDMRNRIKDYAIYYKGNFHKIKQALENGLEIETMSCDSEFVTILDSDYPKSLLSLQYPPFVLFYKGNLELLKSSSISVIGSRRPSQYGIEWTKRAVIQLKEKYTIVSGFARGIDTIAHQQCRVKGKTIAVLGCGISRVYPPENKALFKEMSQEHLIISEYANAIPPHHFHFPIRNRLIAALGEKCLVMAASLRSGTMLTVNEALALNKEVICLPYPIDDKSGEGCNRCILDGAMILTNENDLSMI